MTSSGAGSRGGNVRSVEEARSLHDTHKQEWTEKVSDHIATTLLATGFFHADDLAPLQIPEPHSSIAGSQTSRFVGKGWMVEVGRRKCQHKAANGRKAGIYEITGLGRQELASVGTGVPSPQGSDGSLPRQGASADPGEPASLFPDDTGKAKPISAITDAEAA